METLTTITSWISGILHGVAYMVARLTPVDLAADFNNEGSVDVGDAATIACYIIGKISEL